MKFPKSLIPSATPVLEPTVVSVIIIIPISIKPSKITKRNPGIEAANLEKSTTTADDSNTQSRQTVTIITTIYIGPTKASGTSPTKGVGGTEKGEQGGNTKASISPPPSLKTLTSSLKQKTSPSWSSGQRGGLTTDTGIIKYKFTATTEPRPPSSSLPVPSTTSSSLPQRQKRISTGGILGIVLVGVLVLAVALATVLRFYKKKKAKGIRPNNQSTSGSEVHFREIQYGDISLSNMNPQPTRTDSELSMTIQLSAQAPGIPSILLSTPSRHLQEIHPIPSQLPNIGSLHTPRNRRRASSVISNELYALRRPSIPASDTSLNDSDEDEELFASPSATERFSATLQALNLELGIREPALSPMHESGRVYTDSTAGSLHNGDQQVDTGPGDDLRNRDGNARAEMRVRRGENVAASGNRRSDIRDSTVWERARRLFDGN